MPKTLSLKRQIALDDKPQVSFNDEQTFEPRRNDSFWFDGYVASVTRHGNTIDIMATGHIDVYFPEKNESLDNDDARKYAREMGYTDRKLGSLEWNNNNWFEFRFPCDRFDRGDHNTDSEIVLEHTCTDLKEAIGFAKEVLMDLCKYIKF